jgi:hypothetical protein
MQTQVVRQAAKAAGAIALLVVARRLLAIGQKLTAGMNQSRVEGQRVDAAVNDSFPASDPPSWTRTTVNQSPTAADVATAP